MSKTPTAIVAIKNPSGAVERRTPWLALSVVAGSVVAAPSFAADFVALLPRTGIPDPTNFVTHSAGYTFSVTISASIFPSSITTLARLTGSVKRRGPALPGLRYNTPFRVSCLGT
jgi:hypothetical protein